jgi:hypothetical protein
VAYATYVAVAFSRSTDVTHDCDREDSTGATDPASRNTLTEPPEPFEHVNDVTATFEKLLSMEANEYEALTERGEGFVTASVVDLFGNILGIMYNQHYLEDLDSRR